MNPIVSGRDSANAPRSGVPLWLPLALIAVCLAAGVWYLSSGNPPAPESPAQISDGPDSTEGDARARAERRLRELRAAHEQASGSAREQKAPGREHPGEGGAFRVPGGSSAGGAAKVRPKMGASAAGSDAGEVAPVEQDDPDPDDIPALKRMALEDPDPDRRLAAVTLLGASDDPQAIPILAEVLKDQDEEVRLAAIQSLADMTGDVPVEVLGNAALSDPSPDNRYEALEALADLGGPAARSYIEKALHDPDEDVASLAESLLELGQDSGTEIDQGGPGMADQGR